MGMKDGREPLKNEGDSPPIAGTILWTVLWVFFSITACAPAEAPPAPTISLRLGGAPAEATVTIDEQPIGTLDFVAAHGVALPPGMHHITVQARGYFPWDREVQARPGSPPIHLTATLEPVPD
ncbi:MAG TPA: PEGA domain-containing protein [Polyangiaceae bacterium]|jgi:hypothetical protein|nr:PEGA domain-containing protein [Polyangiaceae bacterium]